jgi:predicted N-formylglutamate amidohydrolase
MKHQIQETKTYKAMDPVVRTIVNRHASQVQIQDAVIQARNIGIEKWREQTALPNRWKAIVEEIVNEQPA